MNSLLQGFCLYTLCCLVWGLQYPPAGRHTPSLCTSLALAPFTCWLDLEPASHYGPGLSSGLLTDLVAAAGAALLLLSVSRGAVPAHREDLHRPGSLLLAAGSDPAWWSSPLLLPLTPAAAAGPSLSCTEVLSLW